MLNKDKKLNELNRSLIEIIEKRSKLSPSDPLIKSIHRFPRH